LFLFPLDYLKSGQFVTGELQGIAALQGHGQFSFLQILHWRLAQVFRTGNADNMSSAVIE